MTFPAHLFERRVPHPDDFIPFDPAEIEGAIATRFEKQVDRYPDRLAYEDADGHRLTYTQLDAAANRVAHHLLAQTASMHAVPVAIYCDPGPLQIIAVMGVIKSGAFVVGLDTTHPANRSLEILTLSQAPLVLTDPANISIAEGFATEHRQVLAVDHLTASGPDARPAIAIDPFDISHLFYTSGSTGQPKGVTHSHRSLLHCIAAMVDLCALRPGDRCALVSPLSFGGSLMQMYAALLAGGTVVPYDTQRRGMQDMGAWLRDMPISVLICNATIVRQLCMYVDDDYQAPHLRLVHTGGEKLRVSDIDLHLRWFPQASLTLTSGSSEGLQLTVTALNPPHPDLDLTAVPCGYASGQHQLLLLDDDGNPVPDGEVGEFAIRSRYLSPGYWRQPDLTDQVFQPDPDDPGYRIFMSGDLGRRTADGLFFHLGRKDSQLKIRGFRIEPAEVESTLTRIDTVREAVVVGHENHHGDLELVAYLVADGEVQPSVDELRQTLAQSLPDHMIPTHFIYIDEMPFTSTKKLDRRRLPAPRRQRPSLSVPYTPPRSPLEERVAAVWAEVLDLDQVGIHDEFFDLGGHSLLAAELIARLAETFELDVSFESLFDAPTVARMSELIRSLASDNHAVIPGIDALLRQDYHKKADPQGGIEDSSS